MNLDFNLCRPVPLPDGTLSYVKEHAKIGAKALFDHEYFALFDEMGGMKTAQSIIGAQFLFLANKIDRVITLAPAAVRPVWFDPELGELAKHLFTTIKCSVHEFHTKNNSWKWGDIQPGDRKLTWIISNYEFVRSEDRLEQLLPYTNDRTLLILDESSSVKSHKSDTAKAAMKLRKKSGRVVLLNGTPIGNSPMDMFSQGQIMSPTILQCKTYFQFRARYAMMGGFMQKQVIGYQNLEDLQARFKPHCLRRLKKDCLDLPPALPAVTLSVPMTEPTWKIYKAMRDDMVAWLSADTAAVASQAANRSMRLAQITSGFVGGIQEDLMREDFEDGVDLKQVFALTKEVGREKLDFLISWHKDRLKDDPNLKLLIFCRFIPELSRLLKEYQVLFPNHSLGAVAGKGLLGGKKKDERDQALRLLNPQTAPPGPVTVGGTFGTGSLGLNFTACHTMVNMSSDYSPWKSEQAAARIDRPGQVHTTSYFDIVMTGPQGQKTIDHIIVKARRNKEEVARWTSSAWVHALTEE